MRVAVPRTEVSSAVCGSDRSAACPPTKEGLGSAVPSWLQYQTGRGVKPCHPAHGMGRVGGSWVSFSRGGRKPETVIQPQEKLLGKNRAEGGSQEDFEEVHLSGRKGSTRSPGSLMSSHPNRVSAGAWEPARGSLQPSEEAAFLVWRLANES